MKKIYSKYNIPLSDFIKDNNNDIINIVTKDGIDINTNINCISSNIDNITIYNKFNKIMIWLETVWNIINNPTHFKELGKLNLYVYGGIARYMVTRKGSFSDIDLYIINDEPGTCQELFLFNVKTLLYKLFSLNLITHFNEKIFYNFHPPLYHYDFGIININNFNDIIINAELVSGKPYNPFSKMDFYINNFCFDRSRKIMLRINDSDMPSLSQTINLSRNKISQHFLLSFNEPSSIRTTFQFVGELFKMIRLFSMFSKGYSITSDFKIPLFSNTNHLFSCSICSGLSIHNNYNKYFKDFINHNNFNSLYYISLQCGHSFHPYCIFYTAKSNKLNIKGLCPDCNFQQPIKLILTNPPLLFFHQS